MAHTPYSFPLTKPVPAQGAPNAAPSQPAAKPAKPVTKPAPKRKTK